MSDLPLPPSYDARPLRREDSRAVWELMAAQEQHDLGEVMIEESDLVGDWQRPSHDLAASSVGVWHGTDLVAYAELSGADRYDAAVHPAHRGRGIGTALAGWVRDLARDRGARVVGMPVPEGGPGDRLLEQLGFGVRWTSWVLDLPPDAVVPTRELPAGWVVRAAHEAEHAAVHALNEDAFLEWSEREREPFDDWAAQVLQRPGFAPWHLRVVVDTAGQVVSMAHLVVVDDTDPPTAYVARLATRADHRGRGLAQALLAEVFAVAREHGASRFRLDTDSRTGALGLYEKVGMVPVQTWVNRALTL